MPDDHKDNPLFDRAKQALGDNPNPNDPTLAKDDQARIAAWLKQHVRDGNVIGPDGKPVRKIRPFMLVRSFPGDNGTRPFNQVFWESPDIWTAPGDPATTPAVPPNHGGVATAGVANTVYAHVWNLGDAPVFGARVDFYWFNPSLGIDGTHGHSIGSTYVDLGPRQLNSCHTLAKCPTAWVPVMENGGHECLVVRVSAVADSIGANDWGPWANRHVAQRNVSVVAAHAFPKKLLDSLEQFRFADASLHLLQVGAGDTHVLDILAPNLRFDTQIKTHELATLSIKGELAVPQASLTAHPQLPFRLMTHNLVADNVSAKATPVKSVANVNIGAKTVNLTAQQANVQTLLAHTALLPDNLTAGVRVANAPKAGEAQVMRIVSYRGDQIVGGYTVVLTG